MAYETTTQRVLDIPEIIELIMSFLDKRDNIQNACVCKRWCEIALDCVWRSVEDITQLLRLLAPLDAPIAIHPLRYYVSIRFQLLVWIAQFVRPRYTGATWEWRESSMAHVFPKVAWPSHSSSSRPLHADCPRKFYYNQDNHCAAPWSVNPSWRLHSIRVMPLPRALSYSSRS